MQINGFKIQELLRLYELEKTSLYEEFQLSLTKFEDEQKRSPEVISKAISEVEEAIVKIQEEQSIYNLQVKVTIDNQEVTLTNAVKRIGSLTKIAKLWKDIITSDKSKRRYVSVETTRSVDHKYAQPTVTRESALKIAKETKQKEALCRAAIASGNGTLIELNIDKSLFERVNMS